MPQLSEGIGQLIEAPRQGPNSAYGVLELKYSVHRDSIKSISPYRIILYGSKDGDLSEANVGDIIHFEGRIRPLEHPINPYQFDYAKYLKNKGIGGVCYASDRIKIGVQNDQGLSLFFERIQAKSIEAFKKLNLSSKELGIASALVLGQRAELDWETKSEFADAGVIHILAVSGLHVGIIYLVIQSLLRSIFKEKRKRLQFFLILIFIWFYAGITGFSPSVLRASTMFSFIALAIIGGKRTNTYNMLAASMILLIITNPLIVKEVGFQLSYLAVIGIVFLFDKVSPLYKSKIWLVQKGWELLVVSFAAQLATAPLSIYYFGQFPNFFLISNLLVIPLATLTLYAGLLYLLTHLIPFLGLAIGFILKWILFLLSEVVQFLSGMQGAVTENIGLDLYQVFLLYGILVVIILFIQKPRKRRIYMVWSVLLISLISFCLNQYIYGSKKELYFLEGKKDLLIMYRLGSRAFIFRSGEMEDEPAFERENRYYVEGLLRKERINEITWIGSTSYKSSFIIKEMNVLLLDEVLVLLNATSEVEEHESSKVKVVLLKDQSHRNDIELENTDLHIIDHFRSISNKEAFRTKYPDLPLWELKEQGALRIDLRDYSEINF